MYLSIYLCVCMCICISMHACLYVYMHVCMYVCIVCMYVCMYVCVCMYACIYVCMYACVYVCMSACAYIHILLHTLVPMPFAVYIYISYLLAIGTICCSRHKLYHALIETMPQAVSPKRSASYGLEIPDLTNARSQGPLNLHPHQTLSRRP